jgi:hypothetical protein
MPKRQIIIPERIVLVDQTTGNPILVPSPTGGMPQPDEPWTFYRFSCRWLFKPEKWGNSIDNLRRYRDVEDVFCRADRHGYATVEVSEADWQLLKQSLEPNPKDPYPPILMGQLMPFIDAIIDAERIEDDE